MMPEHTWALLYLFGAGYIVLHFALYVGVLRNRAMLRTESGIFLYHLVSACFLSMVAVAIAAAFPDSATFAAAIGIVCAHGIYSVTFLEFWSLSQISYSREVLLRVKASGGISSASTFRGLANIGDTKKKDRLSALSTLGLICHAGDIVRLTKHGRVVSRVLHTILWLANIKSSG